MGQPVKLSDDLMLDARLASETSERSMAGQVEFWARLGKAAERLLRGDEAVRLKRLGEARPLSACLAEVGTEAGKARLKEHLAAEPFPHFEAARGRPGALVKIDEDGTRTLGRFVKRQFRPLETK
ncbi:MAG TPA: hypothetical protein VF904_13060 [Anaeromyxobacteraceae bacterium]